MTRLKRLVTAVLVWGLVAACGAGGNAGNDGSYVAPDGPGDPSYYGAIQFQYDQGDCGGLDAIIQGWSEVLPGEAPDPFAASYIAEARKAKVALGCL